MTDLLAAGVSRSLLDSGFAEVTLPSEGGTLLQEAITRSRAFFGLDAQVKKRHTSSDLNFGYRPMGVEYSISPDRPDLNECFTLWADRLDLIPAAEELAPLTDALLGWRGFLVPFVGDIVRHVADAFGDVTPPDFAKASYLQVNFYPQASSGGRDLLQDRHEDGHLLTVIHATDPGLEIWDGLDGARAVSTGAEQVLVMPGSVLTALTGGKVAPLYHQVRNHDLAGRISIMYFVNPELTEPLHPWNGDRKVDLRDQVRNKPSMFGLPDVPVL
ncbi:2OG-Fe(II) oxygenase family protein [Nonomuraea sp. NPDC052265]|uniref:2OG-Fe(II) oxygenase family protein n=1 Tax=Nonomuraea sp. NPDC052265 TaxID=3364374 RepID=UPI0037C521E2